MKWFTVLLLGLSLSSLSAQQFSVGVGGLYQFNGDYIETVEDRKNSIRHIVQDESDSIYFLTLLTTIKETQHVFKANPGWQIEGNFDWNFGGKFSLTTGLGLRGRSWEYDGKPKRLIFYEDFVDTLAPEDVPFYEPTLLCDSIINRSDAQSPSEYADLSVLDIIIPLGIKCQFSDQFDMSANVLFSAPIASKLRNEFTDTDFYMQDGIQFCENFLSEHKDNTGDYFNSIRWSTEVKFTYWIGKFGIQGVLQTTTSPLMKELPETGPDVGQIVTTDSFKPRFVGLVVQYKLGK